MRTHILPLIALAALGLAACREEPTVAEKFNSLAAKVENYGREYEAGAENLVAAEELARMREADALIRETANQLGNSSVAVDVNAN